MKYILYILFLLVPYKVTTLQSSDNALGKPKNIISEYDRIFQKVAFENGLDWHLLSAIAYNESKYQPGVKSKKGAIGIMQIMPNTAGFFNVPFELLYDPFLNINTSAALIKKIDTTFNLTTASENDRLKILIAGYHVGIKNLNEARLMARSAGANCNSWDQLKVFGKVNNSTTRVYVMNVMQKIDEYKALSRQSVNSAI